jgi:proton-dependent oligopeptide transporter, POT family
MFKSLDLNASPRPVQAKPKYRSSADPDLTTMPRGMFYIVGNEAAERFSFYGVSSILTIFMTAYLTDGHGKLAVMDNNEAAFWAHQFISQCTIHP